MHPDRLRVPVETVRELVDEQFRQWRSLTVRALPSQGTVNAVFRIGDRFTARFPLSRKQPAMSRMGRRALERIVADGAPA